MDEVIILKKLYIVGAGGFGREVLWLAKRVNEVEISSQGVPIWDIVGFIDDNKKVHGTTQDDYPVIGGCDYLAALQEDIWVVIAVGAARVKKIIAEKLSQCANIHFATLIDPSVILSDRIEIKEGSIICAGTILTVDITIGKHVILNLDCTVGHDAIIEDYVTAYPSVNISGNVAVEEESELGTGSQIIQGKKIGKQSIVGAGSVVVKDIPERCTAVGSPAKPIKFLD